MAAGGKKQANPEGRATSERTSLRSAKSPSHGESTGHAARGWGEAF